MKVLVSGSTGLIGTDLIPELKAKGHQVARLVRQEEHSGDREILWHPANGELEASDLEGFDAVIHLAGEPIMGRWTEEKKRKILESRVKSTTLLAETMAEMENPPKVFISGSAIGFYGDRNDEELTEVSGAGFGFLPQVSQAWEKAAQPARDKGVRVVNIRTGIVLSPKGGALQMMYWPFKLGVAGNLSWHGNQYMSWISLEDEVAAIIHCLENDIKGPVNLTAPQPLTNAEFSNTLREHLTSPLCPTHYFAPPPLPAWKVKMLLGQMGDELLLSSTKVLPIRLEGSGFKFKHPTLKQALEGVLK